MTIASDGQHLFTSVAWDLAHEQLVVADASGVVQVWNTYTGSVRWCRHVVLSKATCVQQSLRCRCPAYKHLPHRAHSGHLSIFDSAIPYHGAATATRESGQGHHCYRTSMGPRVAGATWFLFIKGRRRALRHVSFRELLFPMEDGKTMGCPHVLIALLHTMYSEVFNSCAYR